MLGYNKSQEVYKILGNNNKRYLDDFCDLKSLTNFLALNL